MKFEQVMNEARVDIIAGRWKKPAARNSLYNPGMIGSVEDEKGNRLNNDQAVAELTKLGVDLTTDTKLATIIRRVTNDPTSSKENSDSSEENSDSSEVSQKPIVDPRKPNLGVAYSDKIIRNKAKKVGWG